MMKLLRIQTAAVQRAQTKTHTQKRRSASCFGALRATKMQFIHASSLLPAAAAYESPLNNGATHSTKWRACEFSIRNALSLSYANYSNGIFHSIRKKLQRVVVTPPLPTIAAAAASQFLCAVTHINIRHRHSLGLICVRVSRCRVQQRGDGQQRCIPTNGVCMPHTCVHHTCDV